MFGSGRVSKTSSIFFIGVFSFSIWLPPRQSHFVAARGCKVLLPLGKVLLLNCCRTHEGCIVQYLELVAENRLKGYKRVELNKFEVCFTAIMLSNSNNSKTLSHS